MRQRDPWGGRPRGWQTHGVAAKCRADPGEVVTAAAWALARSSALPGAGIQPSWAAAGQLRQRRHGAGALQEVNSTMSASLSTTVAWARPPGSSAAGPVLQAWHAAAGE